MRQVPDPGFGDDDGAADPRLAAALAEYAARRLPESELLATLAGARLLVPVLAVPAAGPGERRTDMALVTLRAADGSRALPAFSCLDTLAAWNGSARPVPVPARRACLAALAEAADTLLVDLGSPAMYQLTGPALRALADGRLPLPPLADPLVRAAVYAAALPEPVFRRVSLVPPEQGPAGGREGGPEGGPEQGREGGSALGPGGGTARTGGDLTVRLLPDPAEPRDRVAVATQRVAGRLAADPVIRDRVGNGLQLVVAQPTTGDRHAPGKR